MTMQSTLPSEWPEALAELQGMRRVGFDTSSLNCFGKLANVMHTCELLRKKRVAPILSSLSIVEILRWEDDEARRRLLAAVSMLQGVASYLLLPFPLDVVETWLEAWFRNQQAWRVGGDELSRRVLARLYDSQENGPDLAMTVSRLLKDDAEQGRTLQGTFRRKVQPIRTQPQRSAEESCVQLLAQPDHMRRLIKELLAPVQLAPSQLTDDAVVKCVQDVASLRTFLVSNGIWAIRGSRRLGLIDVDQAAYLPLFEWFVVDDRRMREHLSVVGECTGVSTRLIGFADFQRVFLRPAVETDGRE